MPERTEGERVDPRDGEAQEGANAAAAMVQAAADLSAVEQQQIFRLMSFGFSRKKIAEALREQAQGREMADEARRTLHIASLHTRTRLHLPAHNAAREIDLLLRLLYPLLR